MKQAHYLIALLGALTLTACGGGHSSGGGGNSGGTGPIAATYTIGGMVQGLSAYSSSGMVLADNGGNDLTVAGDGAFTFTQAVNSGANYVVTVATQPTGESCTVTGGTSTASANVTSVMVSCASSLSASVSASSNAAAVEVGSFPADVTAAAQTFNVPIVTVKVCGVPSTNCANVQVVVDTGSSGLRLMQTTAVNGLHLASETAAGGNNVFECAYYADGYAWGGVATAAQVQIGTETATNVPVQVIEAGAGGNPPADVPTACSTGAPPNTSDLDSPDSFSADGVLGVGPAAQDCGAACTTTPIYYYNCPAGGACTAGSAAVTIASVSDEVTNPVALFAKDNNGTLLQLPSIAATGAAMATGYLAFGVGTESYNGIGNGTILPLSGTQPQLQQPMYLTTSFNGTNNIDGIIDSGSNALYFSDSGLLACTTFTGFYCPTTTQSLTATNSGGGNTSQVPFQITNLETFNQSNFAINDVGGTAPTINGTTYFDFGVPFFYGRTVYTIIGGTTLGGQPYAEGAFAY